MINRDTPIFLVGYMGSGKSTIGRRLADRMERKFIDTDIFIEQRFHESVANMFASVGEEAFRRREAVVIEELSGFPNVLSYVRERAPRYAISRERLSRSIYGKQWR